MAEASASELQTRPRGRLRLVAPVGFGSESLGPALVDFLEAYPDVSVELSLDNRPPDLMDGDHELGVHIGEIDSADLVARPLKPYRRILAAAPGYLDRHGRPRSPEELRHHSCLGLSYWRTAGLAWTLVGPGGEVREISVKGRFTANQGRALRAAALHGAGILLQPEPLLTEDIAAGRLEPVLPEWSYKPVPMFLTYARDRRPTALLRSAVDFLASRFG